jgi:hypothetical protein
VRARTHKAVLPRGPPAVKKQRRADGSDFLTLPRLEALLRLVDDIDAALAPHQAVIAMAVAQGFQRITDFHDITEHLSRAGISPWRTKKNALYASIRPDDQEDKAVVRAAGGGLVSDQLTRHIRPQA